MIEKAQQLDPLQPGHFRHVVVKGKFGIENDVYQIREQYGMWGIGSTARTPYGYTLEELKHVLRLMLEACERTVIDESKPVDFEVHEPPPTNDD